MTKILSDNVRKKTNHDICVSAKHHSDQHLSVMLEFYTTKQKEINEFITDYNKQYPNYQSRFFSGFYEVNKIYKDYDTLAIDTEMSQELMENLRTEIRKTYYLQKQIADVIEKVNFKGAVYNPFSLQFENAALFTPSSVKFYQFMKETVYEQFPEVKGMQFAAFIVKSGATALGTHNARPPSIHYKELFEQGIAMPEIHKTFWISLTENTYKNQPLMIFEDSGSESPSMAYMYKTIKQKSDLFSSENLKAVDTAFYRFTYKDATFDEKIFTTFYMHALYLQSKYCNITEKVYGQYWELKPGQGIIFNNFKAHGDITLPKSESDRITVAFRCFSETKTYESVFGGRHSLFQRLVDSNEKQRECLLKILGYNDKKDFLKTLYDENYSDDLLDIPFTALLTDTAMGYSGTYKGPERMDIFTISGGLNRHYERSKDFFQSEEYVLNDNAKQCIEEYYLNLKEEDFIPGYYDGHTVGDIYLYLKHKATNLKINYIEDIGQDMSLTMGVVFSCTLGTLACIGGMFLFGRLPRARAEDEFSSNNVKNIENFCEITNEVETTSEATFFEF